MANQKLEELIVVFSNSDMTGTVTSSGSSVEAKSAGCENWRGTIKWKYEATSVNSYILWTSVAEVYFKNITEPGTNNCLGGEVPCEFYTATGTVDYYQLFEGGCTYTFDPPPTAIAPVEQAYLFVYTDPDPPTYEGAGLMLVTGPYTNICPGRPDESGVREDGDLWFYAPPEAMLQLKENGTVIDDTYLHGNFPYEWHLERAP